MGHVAFNVWRNVLPSTSRSSTLLGLRALKHKVAVIPHPLTLCHIPQLYLHQHHCEKLKLHSSLLIECARPSQLTLINTSTIYFSDHEMNTRFIPTKSWSSPALFRNKLPFATVPTAALQQNFWQTLHLLIASCGNYQPKFKLPVFSPSAKVSSYCLGACSFFKLLHTHTEQNVIIL